MLKGVCAHSLALDSLLSDSANRPFSGHTYIDHLKLKLAPATRLRKGRQLAWVLGARLSDVGARHCAGDIDALWPFELLNLLQAIYEEAALQQMDSNGMVLCDHLRAAAVGARKGL